MTSNRSGEWQHAHLLRCQVCGASFTHHAGATPDLAAAKQAAKDQAAHTAGWRMASGHWACGGCSRARTAKRQAKVGGKR